MSEKEDYIIVTIADTHAGTDNNVDVGITQESETELTENTLFTDGTLTIQPNFQGSDGEGGLPVPGDQAVSQMSQLATLKRQNSNSLEVEFLPLQKKQSSFPRGEYTESNASESFSDENHRNQLMELQHHCEVLQELMDHTNKQVNHICRIVSKLQSSWEKPSLPNCGVVGPLVPEDQQETQPVTNPVGASLPSAASSVLQQPDPRQRPPTPKIVSEFSLQSNCTLGYPAPGLAASSYFVNEGVEEIPVTAETSLENNPKTTNYPTSLGSDSDQYSSPALYLPNFAFEKVILTQTLEKAETNLENSSQTSLGNDRGSDPASSSQSIPPNFESSREMSSETLNSSSSVENDGDQDTNSESFFLIPGFGPVPIGIVRKAGSVIENRPYPTESENDKSQDFSPSSFCMPPNFESSREMSSETLNSSSSVENDGDQDTNSESFFLIPGFGPVPIGIVRKAGSVIENRPYPTESENDKSQDFSPSSFCMPPNFGPVPIGIVRKAGSVIENRPYPTESENDKSQDFSPSSFCMPPNFGYLGDPKRNVRVLETYLLAAQRKANPRNAVRYLIHILFSKEVLMNSWVGVNLQGLQPLDPNKMAALREYLISVFPNHDLRECGKDWQTIIGDINSLIYCLRVEAKTTPQKTGANTKGPTNPDRPVAANLNDTRYDKGSSQLSQRRTGSETRGKGNSQQNSSACTEGIKEHSTDNSVVFYEALEYFGNPNRNIKLPLSVLSKAKAKTRPELSARYLIRNLFTEEVLMRSNVYGNAKHGMYALNPNRISALREFLKDAYPDCDLSESGYDWKLCVAAINSCIRCLRYDSKKSTSKAEMLPATTPSAESESRN